MCEVLDKIEARKEAQVREGVAVNLLNANAPLNLIKIASELSEEDIRAIAKKIGVEVVEG
jgi:hypothetical protein